ncbi:MAG: MBL fold metallo-hydrolase [Phycisphaeraceae bacterium]|nr:MBL fold metallo-hydrolase [Phycisphaeraceae bacterium]
MMTTINTPLTDWQYVPLEANQIACWWLGQAGFLFRSRDISFIVDPYLSDSLAVKYRHAQFKHVRMMPVPVAPSDLTGLDWVFVTHEHTDHMDGSTLWDLLAANPDCHITAPMATEQRLIHDMGVERARVTLVDRDQHVQLSPGLAVHVIASAHETLEIDEAGHCACLGYMVELAGTRIYHSGDCVPYEGLSETLKALHIDVALLPVNGRDATRTGHGILGNFHFEEAVSLCCDAGIDTLVPHHFGMFDFNTVDPAVLQAKIEGLDGCLQLVVPQLDQALLMDGSS